MYSLLEATNCVQWWLDLIPVTYSRTHIRFVRRKSFYSIPQKAGNPSGYPCFKAYALSDTGSYMVKVLTLGRSEGTVKNLYFYLELVVYCKGGHHESTCL
jgi:hypothetical protein